MSVNRRDRVVLSVIGVAVMSYVGYAIHDAVAVPGVEPQVTMKPFPGYLPTEPADSVDMDALVMGPNPFTPLVTVAPADGEGSSVTAGPSAGFVSLADAESHSRDGWASAPGGGGDGEGEGSSGPAEPIKIALVGVVTGTHGPQALVENEEHKSAYVGVNDEAYGYTLVALSSEGAMFSKDERMYVLKVGDGKKVAKPEASSKPSEGESGKSEGGPPGGGRPGGGMPSMSFGGGGGGSWGGGMSPEMMERYRGSRGGGGSDRGRGRGGGPPGMGFRGR